MWFGTGYSMSALPLQHSIWMSAMETSRCRTLMHLMQFDMTADTDVLEFAHCEPSVHHSNMQEPVQLADDVAGVRILNI